VEKVGSRWRCGEVYGEEVDAKESGWIEGVFGRGVVSRLGQLQLWKGEMGLGRCGGLM
jgi:hypothetical protein